jgi:hypothetical protein
MKYAFENLEVWQKSRGLVKSVYQLTGTFPPEEKFGLTSQLRRASIWTVAIRLQDKLPAQIIMPVKRFRIFFFIPLVYIALIMLFAGYVFFNDISRFGQPSRVQLGGLIGLILPVHLFAVFCILHTLYFVAKSLKTAEQQKVVRVSDFAGDFALLWLFPIGIWFIQPRINQLFDPSLNPSDVTDHMVN